MPAVKAKRLFVAERLHFGYRSQRPLLSFRGSAQAGNRETHGIELSPRATRAGALGEPFQQAGKILRQGIVSVLSTRHGRRIPGTRRATLAKMDESAGLIPKKTRPTTRRFKMG
jgi:hypothetical protein